MEPQDSPEQQPIDAPVEKTEPSPASPQPKRVTLADRRARAKLEAAALADTELESKLDAELDAELEAVAHALDAAAERAKLEGAAWETDK